MTLDELCGLEQNNLKEIETQADLISSIDEMRSIAGASYDIEEQTNIDTDEVHPIFVLRFPQDVSEWLAKYYEGLKKLLSLNQEGLIDADVVISWQKQQMKEKTDFLVRGIRIDDLPFQEGNEDAAKE